MSDNKKNEQQQGRIPARAMYNKSKGALPQQPDEQWAPTRIMPPVTDGDFAPAPQRMVTKRVTSQVDDSAEQVVTQVVVGQERTRQRRSDRHKNQAVQSEDKAIGGTEVEAGYYQAEPINAVPLRGNQSRRTVAPGDASSQAGGEPAMRPVVRRPVPAQGYAQARPQSPGAAYNPAQGQLASQNQDQHMARARRPQPEAEYLEDEDEQARKPHGFLIALLTIVLVVALAVVGLMLLPEGDTGILGTLNGIKASMSGQVGTLVDNVKNVFSPVQKIPAQALEFTAMPTAGNAPVEVVFNLTTTKSVSGVRILDQNGEVLDTQVSITTDNEESKIWSLNMVLDHGYMGQVEASIQDEENWLLTGKIVNLNIGEPVATPAPTPVATPEATATPTPTDVPVPTATAPAIVPVAMPTETPAPTDTPAPIVAPVPTETLVPTESPAPAPTSTLAPTDSPAPTNTPAPSPSPEPTVSPMPYIGATSIEDTAPSKLAMTTTVYQGSKTMKDFLRTTQIQMPSPDEYADWQGGVITFRGGPFRQNAAFGKVEVENEELSILWSADMGGLDSYHGAGWGAQPAIVKWPKEIRELMNISDEKKAVYALKEVIMASQDGKIYFLDLADGLATREPIKIGFPLKSGISIDPRGYPMLMVGQGYSSLKSGTGKIGYYLFNLIDQKQMMLLNGRDTDYKRPYRTIGSFDGTALIDSNSDTMIVAGENGLLYTVSLNSKFNLQEGTLTIDPNATVYRAKAGKENKTKVGIEGSVTMYGQYAYFADEYGLLQCVDTNTMSPVWAVNAGDNTDATIALDFDADGTLGLYTANTLKNQGKKGTCTIRRLDALSGQEVWQRTFDVKYDKDEQGGVMASPVVGQNSISNLVIFTVAKTEAGGAIVALDKKTGDLIWQQDMTAYSWSSPVAVYNEAGDAWVIQGNSDGNLHLMDGQTGEILNTLQLDGKIEASPAVYNDVLVIGTSGKDVSKIYGIQIQ